MMARIQLLIVPTLVAVVALFLLLLVRSLLFRLMRRWGAKSETAQRIFPVLKEALGVPSIYWCIALALYGGMAVSELPGKYLFYFSRAIQVILVFSITLATSNVAARIFKTYAQKTGIPISGTALVDGAIKGSILIIGILVILSMLGVSIAPLLTALGVGGLAVALALQDTLANLFAGFHILVEKSLRVGDFVRIESGQEGYVDDITWRTTRVRTLSNSIVVVPNRKMAQSVVVNYSLPNELLTTTVALRVDASADPEKVEQIMAEETRKILRDLPGTAADQEPTVAFGIGDNFLEFTLSVSVHRFAAQSKVQNELRKRLFQRLRQEGIEHPNRRPNPAP
jgi:small-conductance mechanosensitive channel